MRKAALPLVAAVLLAAPAGGVAAVKSELSRWDGLRLTLDGRTLTAEIVHRPRVHRIPSTEEQLFGTSVLGACGTTFRPTRKGLVWNRRLWPPGARRVSFAFARDVSRRARWCLIEGEESIDVAFVSFVDREPGRLIAKGRGPSGAWWRVSAWRGEKMEPCMALRTSADPSSRFRPCFDELAEREATLAATVEEPREGGGDTHVLGAVGRAAAAVRVRLGDGSVEHADLYDRPRGSRVRARFFVLVLPRGTDVDGVRAVDAEGRTVGRERERL